MKGKFLAFLSAHYRRYHDVFFYLLVLTVIVVFATAAYRVTQQKNAQERENAYTRDIPVEVFTVGQKPIYVALQEAGLSKQNIAQIVSKLSTLVDTRKLQKQDEYSLSTENGQLIMLLLTQGFKRFFIANVDGALVSGVSDVEIKTRIRTAAGEVKGSLFNSMLAQGLQVPLILDFTDAFSWTIDFNTDTRNGDKYTALWEENYTANGEITSQDLLAASYTGADWKACCMQMRKQLCC